jgi:hypothetical protein
MYILFWILAMAGMKDPRRKGPRMKGLRGKVPRYDRGEI